MDRTCVDCRTDNWKEENEGYLWGWESRREFVKIMNDSSIEHNDKLRNIINDYDLDIYARVTYKNRLDEIKKKHSHG